MEPDSFEKQIPSPVEEIIVVPPKKTSTSHLKIYLATFAAQLYIITMGIVAAYSSPACADMRKPGSRFQNITFDEITWIASLPMLSGVFGNAFSGYACHKFGRKATLMYLSLPYALSWVMIAYAPTVPVVYVARIICGICSGMCTVAVPTYVVEISTIEIRGLLTATFQVAVALGAFTVTAFGIFLRWSWLALVGSAVAVSGASLLLFMPESPLWLVKASRRGEAAKAIKFLKGENYDAEKEIREIAQHLEDEPKATFSLDMLLDPGLYKPLLIAVVLPLNMSFAGFAVILSYAVEVLQTSSNSINPNVAATIVMMVQVLATAVSSLLMDRAGRKVLYIISGISMTFCLVILGIHSYFTSIYQPDEMVRWRWVPIFSLVAYLATFSIGFGSIPFVVLPELVPTASRSFVVAVGAFVGSLSGFVMTKIFDDMRNSLGLYGTYWTYGVLSMLGVAFDWYFVPETKGRDIHDIHKSFSGSK